MKKILFFNLLPISILSTTLISAKNDFDNEEDKEEKYVICDYIKLTGRQNAEIIYKNNIIGGVYPKSKIFWFKNRGYSIFDYESKEICEVNPDALHITGFINKPLEYNSPGKFSIYDSQLRDKTISGDHKRNDEFWKKKKKYYQFTYQDYLNIKNAKQSEFNKYKIKAMKNNFVYADHEVLYSWWFKSASNLNFGNNSELNSFIPSDPDEFHYYKRFQPYYKTRYFLKQSNGGICGYVGMTMLMLYNEYFKGSYYFDEFERTFLTLNYPNNYFNKNDLKKSLSNYIIPELSDNFLKYLYQKTWFGNGIKYWWHYKYILDSMLYYKWKDNKLNYSYEGKYFDIKDTIIMSKKPIAIGGSYGARSKGGHVVIAYGVYDDGRYLCNFGWSSQYTQVIIKEDIDSFRDNIAINHKWDTTLKKYFNYEGKYYTGIELDNIMRKKGYID